MKPLSLSSRIFQAIILVFVLSGCGATTPMRARFAEAPVVTPFQDNYWLLRQDLIFEAVRESDKTLHEITVPAGFVTDLASIPVPLNAIYSMTGRYSSAGILHDYLYWTQFCDREKSDRLIKEGLKATDATDGSYLTRNTIKIGVKWFGWIAWDSNKTAKSQGQDRFVPERMRSFPSNTSWETYRKAVEDYIKNSDPSDPSIQSPWQHPSAKETVRKGCNVFVEGES